MATATLGADSARTKTFAPDSEPEAYKTAHAAIEFGEKLSPLVDSVRAVVGAIEYGDLLGNVPVIPERYLIAADLLRLLKFQADTLHGEQLLVWDDAANAVDVLAGVLECGADVGAGQ